MTVNSISPGWLKVSYFVGTHPHHQILPIKPITPVPGESDGFATTKDGDTYSIPSWLEEQYYPAWQPLFSTAASINQVELWSKPTPDDDPIWIFTYSGAGIVGTAGGTAVAAGQLMLTYRSLGGGIFKQYFMETPYPVNVVDPAPFSNAAQAGMADVITNNLSIVCARDNGFIGAELKSLTKTNDALRKKYLLNA